MSARKLSFTLYLQGKGPSDGCSVWIKKEGGAYIMQRSRSRNITYNNGLYAMRGEVEGEGEEGRRVSLLKARVGVLA